MVVISSSPIFPPSPAWGFKPQTRDARARQAEIATSLRREFDGQFDFLARQPRGHFANGNVNGGQRHAQPAIAIVGAQQHHRGAIGACQFGEQFGLADERGFAGANDGFLVHRRGDESAGFAAQAKLRAVLEPGERGTRGFGSAGLLTRTASLRSGLIAPGRRVGTPDTMTRAVS